MLMRLHRAINVRPTDWLTENNINQYSVNTVPIRLFRPRMSQRALAQSVLVRP